MNLIWSKAISFNDRTEDLIDKGRLQATQPAEAAKRAQSKAQSPTPKPLSIKIDKIHMIR